jgi:hypothetical protein
MKRYRVYSIATASVCLGEFEAETEDEAKEKALAENPPDAMLCHQCAGEIELGDFYEEQADEI